jgi:pyrrolidone-carboxylate peptidase
MTLIYAFSNQWGTNVSHRVLLELQKLIPTTGSLYYQLVRYHPQNFFKKYIKNNHYSLIIGLGDFYGNIEKIRIETIAHNVYGQNTISAFSPISLELSLPILDYVDSSLFTISEHMGTYNCNWIVYQTQLFINQYSPLTKQLFFHLPKRHPAPIIAQNIFTLLQNNNLIQ